MKDYNGYAVGFAVLVFAAINSTELIAAWKNAPIEQDSWIPFLLWLLPVPYFLLMRRPLMINSSLLWFSLAFTLLGILTTLNVLKYVGLACALAAFIPWHLTVLPWLLSSVAWMSAFGWLGIRFAPDYLFGIRLLVVCLGLACLALNPMVFSKKEQMK